MLIKNLEHLKELSKNKEQLDCYVMLSGYARSSKTLILHENGAVTVNNEIDDTQDEFDSFEDMNKRHLTINEALEKHAFFVYDYEVKT